MEIEFCPCVKSINLLPIKFQIFSRDWFWFEDISFKSIGDLIPPSDKEVQGPNNNSLKDEIPQFDWAPIVKGLAKNAYGACQIVWDGLEEA